MTRSELLDLYFVDARSKLLDIGAFLDRLDRAEGEADFRLEAFQQALRVLLDTSASRRAEKILLALSDPTTEPIPVAAGKSASGAWNPQAAKI